MPIASSVKLKLNRGKANAGVAREQVITHDQKPHFES